jgi:hypothetical protein
MEELLMSDQVEQKSGGFGKLIGWIGGITGVLLVIPALINAGLDVYNAALDIPKTEAEAVNVDLFKKYFGKSPLFRADIPVKTELGEVNMELEVHEGGDIFVRYGRRSQWFESPLQTQTVYFPFLRSAHAQEVGAVGKYYQYDRMKDNELLRERYFPDGRKESYVVDPLTGTWSNPTIGTYEAVPSDAIPEMKTYQLPVIDLTNPDAPL